MTIRYRAFEDGDYDAARSLWEATEGVGLSSADQRPAIERFLRRNPLLSRVAYDSERLVGTILVGHDGRRGFIHHLAVACSSRRQGIGRTLVREGLDGLAREGIEKCHLLVFADNPEGRAFWKTIGAEHRDALVIYSFPVPGTPGSVA